MMNNVVKSGQLSSSLYRSLRNSRSAGNVPGLLRQIIQMKSWEGLSVEETGEIAKFSTFPDYVKAPPPEGLGSSLDEIRRWIPGDDKELLDMFNEACPQRREIEKALSKKKELLQHYARKEVNRYLQLDCFINVEPGDDIVIPDQDGDCLFGSVTDELRSGNIAVRIQVLEGTSKEDAIRAIKKLLEWAERDYHKLIEPELFITQGDYGASDIPF